MAPSLPAARGHPGSLGWVELPGFVILIHQLTPSCSSCLHPIIGKCSPVPKPRTLPYPGLWPTWFLSMSCLPSSSPRKIQDQGCFYSSLTPAPAPGVVSGPHSPCLRSESHCCASWPHFCLRESLPLDSKLPTDSGNQHSL